MDLINFAVRRITQDIPTELLVRAFGRKLTYGHQDTRSIEAAIQQDVITDYIYQDLNCVIGTHVDINIGTLPQREINNAIVIDIPLNMTQGRHISRVLSIETGTPDNGGSGSMADQLLAGNTGPESTGTARIEIVAPNVIAIYERITGSNVFLKCMLANSPNFSNLNPAYQRHFVRLAVMAAKSIIYQRLNISVGDGTANGAPTDPQLRGELDRYADINELYNEEIETKWRKINILGDPKAKNRHIRSILG